MDCQPSQNGVYPKDLTMILSKLLNYNSINPLFLINLKSFIIYLNFALNICFLKLNSINFNRSYLYFVIIHSIVEEDIYKHMDDSSQCLFISHPLGNGPEQDLAEKLIWFNSVFIFFLKNSFLKEIPQVFDLGNILEYLFRKHDLVSSGLYICPLDNQNFIEKIIYFKKFCCIPVILFLIHTLQEICCVLIFL
uniref:Uncharacterized protein n=1 Tax=Heterorhabditis bacteriophora TaxID=37862 RepID=A0A1I7WDQ1_HETBA